MELAYDEIRVYWQHRHPGQRIAAREKVTVCCALHGEKNPSCTLFLDGNGGFHCHACGAKGNLFQFEARFSSCDLHQAELNVAQITGATPSRSLGDLGPPVAFYDYRDENGILLYQKRRYQPEMRPKTFLIYRATSKGLVVKLDPPDGPKTRRVLYNLPHVIKANLLGLCESEKDCDNCTNANLFASAGYSIAYTCTYDGAWQEKHSPKWLDTYDKYFSGKFVIIFAHNDAPGRLYAETAAAHIEPYAYSVRIVYFPELPDKGDVSDYLELHTVAELEEKIKSAPAWKGQAVERKSWLVEAFEWTATNDPAIDWLIDGVIQRNANGIIAAEPKTGKSLSALDMLLSLASGVSWLDQTVPKRALVAYISREDSPTLTKVRIKGFVNGKKLEDYNGHWVDPTNYLWINTREQVAEFNIDNDEHLHNMAHDLKERGIEFAVLDVFNRLHLRDENSNTEMAQVVERIAQMGRYAGCSIGLIHHLSKDSSSGRFFTRIRGASAIHGWTEWSIGLSLHNPNSDGLKLLRKAEFESKAGECTKPIYFTVEFSGVSLQLKTTTLADFNTASTQKKSDTSTTQTTKNYWN